MSLTSLHILEQDLKQDLVWEKTIKKGKTKYKGTAWPQKLKYENMAAAIKISRWKKWENVTDLTNMYEDIKARRVEEKNFKGFKKEAERRDG